MTVTTADRAVGVSRSERFTWTALRVAAVATPVLGAVTGLLHPSFDGAEEIPELATESGWYGLHLALLVMGGCMLAAVVALSRELRPARPLLTTIGSWLLAVGAVAWIGLMAIEMAMPMLAEDPATWDSMVEFFESPGFAPFLAGFVLTSVGVLFLGLAAVLDNRRPRWQGGLIVAGAVLTAPDSVAVNTVGAVLLAAGIIGVLFLTRPSTRHQEATS